MVIYIDMHLELITKLVHTAGLQFETKNEDYLCMLNSLKLKYVCIYHSFAHLLHPDN